MRAAAIVVLLFAALAGSFYAGVQHQRARNLAAVAEVQQAVFDLGQVIQQQQQQIATDTRQAVEQNHARVDSIPTTTKQLQRAQQQLDACLSSNKNRSANAPAKTDGKNRRADTADFSVYSPAVIVRLWNQARRHPHLPENPDPARLPPAAIPPPTNADRLGQALKTCITDRDRIAVQYNGLYQAFAAATATRPE